MLYTGRQDVKLYRLVNLLNEASKPSFYFVWWAFFVLQWHWEIVAKLVTVFLPSVLKHIQRSLFFLSMTNWTSESRRCNSTISVTLWNHWPLKTCQSCHACITVLFGFSCCHFRWNKFSLSGAILLKAKKITPCLKGFNYWEIIPKFQQNERAGLKLALSAVGRIRNDLVKFGKVS